SEEGDRALYGAKLYREGKAPRVILSGGRIQWRSGGGPPEATDMAQIIQTMGVPAAAIVQEPYSRNTHENAVNVRRILDAQGIPHRVLLVTSALHMPRSLLIFKRQGIDAIAAPTDFLITDYDLAPNSLQGALLDSLPDADELQRSTRALKEYVGLAVYWLRGWL
ncbi:MAG TPA: YdcF family protein, partial [Candidatus Caenarcaniphilales bacterium]